MEFCPGNRIQFSRGKGRKSWVKKGSLERIEGQMGVHQTCVLGLESEIDGHRESGASMSMDVRIQKDFGNKKQCKVV